MKKLLLLSILFIVGCPPPTAPEPEDCAGVPGGDAVVDECGVCKGSGFAQNGKYCSDVNVLQEIIDLNDSLNSITSIQWNIGGRIQFLNLHDSQISHIPPSISTLSYLEQLWLGNNQISEDIFQYISNLTNLNSLYLHNNYISGVIPDTLCNIYEKLSYFYIGHNELCPPYPSCFSSPLQSINVNQNSLERIRVDDASFAYVNVFKNSLEIIANGFIGGVQMTLEHGNDFTFDMTDQALFADYLTSENETRLIVITPETAEIFSYIGEFEIIEIIVANSEYEIDFEVIYYRINGVIGYQDTTNCE